MGGLRSPGASVIKGGVGWRDEVPRMRELIGGGDMGEMEKRWRLKAAGCVAASSMVWVRRWAPNDDLGHDDFGRDEVANRGRGDLGKEGVVSKMVVSGEWATRVVRPTRDV
ncbi:unnamed protein product [Sphenostylis stenocarpa]|uniref:Uncharacterized protein n=1 Tax=Sphenostylis stenocarpa TaxID=92480 RepID=A0AA86SLR0_9FABA|nr:unnamed protein product [Sphenostylis stenocarpa]